MQMYDTETTGVLKIDEIIKLLSSINRTSSYFGDPCLTEQEIISLAEESFNVTDGSAAKLQDFTYSDFLNNSLDHPHFTTFVTGNGTARYGLGIS